MCRRGSIAATIERITIYAAVAFRARACPACPGLSMAAYEAAMSGARTAIGAGRIKPGSVAAVIAEYKDSREFFGSKSAGTQRMRRGILDRFGAAYGERPLALLPPEWIEALLDSKSFFNGIDPTRTMSCDARHRDTETCYS